MGVTSAPGSPALWTTDGTAAGTHPVRPFGRARNTGRKVAYFLPGRGDQAIFVGVRGFDDFQVWTVSEDAVDAVQLTALPPLSERDNVAPARGQEAAVGGRLVFGGPDGALWTSRGSLASTHRLAGCPGGCPAQATLWGELPGFPGSVLFAGGTAESGISLWATDGTGAGSRKLVDLCPGPCDPPLRGGLFLGKLFFFLGQQLWVTDGSPEGTRALSPARTPDPGQPSPLAAAGGRVFFTATVEPDGLELASTDGTPEGTTILASLAKEP
jgi:ELWxxDGT repeat protein